MLIIRSISFPVKILTFTWLNFSELAILIFIFYIYIICNLMVGKCQNGKFKYNYLRNQYNCLDSIKDGIICKLHCDLLASIK